VTSLKHASRILALIFSVYTFSRTRGALDRPLATWDEAIYYNVATNVLDGRWLLPLHSAADHPLGVVDPFLHKPPLVYWLFAGGMRLFGEAPSSARLITAVATALLVAVAVLLTARLAGLGTAALAGITVSRMPAIFGTHAGNNAATDPFLVLFSFAAVYAFVLAIDAGDYEPYYAGIAGLLGGFAFLSKGMAAGPIAIGCLPLAYAVRDELTYRSWALLFATAIVVITPWFVAVGFLAPDELWHQMIQRQTVARATGSAFASNPGTFPFMDAPYFRRAPGYFGVSWWLLPVCVAVLSVDWFYNGVDRTSLFTIPLFVAIVGIYSVAGNHQWYFLPAAPALAILISDTIIKSLSYKYSVLSDS